MLLRLFYWFLNPLLGFSDGSVFKESTCNARDVGDTGSIPGSGQPPGGGNGNPLQYSCWKIPRTEEPGGLWSMGSQTVGHDWGDLAQITNPLWNYLTLETFTNAVLSNPENVAPLFLTQMLSLFLTVLCLCLCFLFYSVKTADLKGEEAEVCRGISVIEQILRETQPPCIIWLLRH